MSQNVKLAKQFTLSVHFVYSSPNLLPVIVRFVYTCIHFINTSPNNIIHFLKE